MGGGGDIGAAAGRRLYIWAAKMIAWPAGDDRRAVCLQRLRKDPWAAKMIPSRQEYWRAAAGRRLRMDPGQGLQAGGYTFGRHSALRPAGIRNDILGDAVIGGIVADDVVIVAGMPTEIESLTMRKFGDGRFISADNRRNGIRRNPQVGL